MSKYKYYFRKPKSEIIKDILNGLWIGGMVCIACATPPSALSRELMKKIRKYDKNKQRRFGDAFYQLKKQGLIKIKWSNHQAYISLTEEGKKKANWMQIDALKIKKPKRWDKKWRIVIFDIPQFRNFYREIFRGKLKQLEFYQIQKSVWISPYKCEDEINLLKDFLGMSDNEIRLIVAENIGEDKWLKRIFRI